MKVILLVVATVALTLAEPPVPSSRYLPGNYATTNQDSFAPPSSEYGAPSRSYGAPFGSQTTAVIKPNVQYRAPSSQYGAPSSQYGAPRASNNYLPPSSGYSSGNGGYGRGGYDDGQSEPANYNFEYHVEDGPSYNDFGHKESRQGDVAQGKYFVLLPDGRRQTVEYTADHEGYKPRISYEQVSNGNSGGYGRNGGYSNGGYSGGNGGGNGGYSGGNGGGNGGYQY